MFLTDEERRPLGGFGLFLLPMICIGSMAGGMFFFARNGEAASLAGISALCACACLLSLLFIYKAASPISSILAAGLSGLFLAGSFIFYGDAVQQHYLPLVLSAYAVVSLAGGIVNYHADQQPGLLPSYRYVFVMALALPVWGLILALFSLLIALLGGAIFGLTENWWQTQQPSVSVSLVYALMGALVGGLLAVVRMQRVLLGTLRFAILWAARYLLPVIVVVAGARLLSAFGANAADQTSLLLAAIFFCVLWLNYQEGAAAKPSLWLRIFIWAGLLIIGGLLWPFAKLLAGARMDHAVLYLPLLMLLTLAVSAVAAFSDILPLSRRWMPLLGPATLILLGVIALGPLLLSVSTRFFQ